MTRSAEISTRIVQAVLARQIEPGSRLGEQQLADLFDCSRTIVREALTNLAARGIVTVSARRGWFVAEPSRDDTREAFEARLVIETGLIRSTKSVDKAAVKRLRAHIDQQKNAIKSDDIALRSFLLGDFHVCLAECLGNGTLADILRDLTARTTLAARRYQTLEDATRSHEEHAEVVEALAAGNIAAAERLVSGHLSTWQDKLHIPAEDSDAVDRLRRALKPMPVEARNLHTRPLGQIDPKRQRLRSRSGGAS